MWKDLVRVFIEKNSQLNLSAIRDAKGIKIKHINDSIELNKILKIEEGKSVCDIGTGGGFPLLPLAISSPSVKFVGIDARRKKVDAVNDMIHKLGLKNAVCKRSRIEDFDEKFDFITARAVAHVDKLIPRSYKLLKKGGFFVLYKQYDDEEFSDLKNLCKKYKLKIIKKHKYCLFEGDIERVIYLLKKI